MSLILKTKTKPHMYVHALHGVDFVSFIPEQHKHLAFKFPSENRKQTVELISESSGLSLMGETYNGD